MRLSCWLLLIAYAGFSKDYTEQNSYKAFVGIKHSMLFGEKPQLTALVLNGFTLNGSFYKSASEQSANYIFTKVNYQYDIFENETKFNSDWVYIRSELSALISVFNFSGQDSLKIINSFEGSKKAFDYKNSEILYFDVQLAMYDESSITVKQIAQNAFQISFWFRRLY